MYTKIDRAGTPVYNKNKVWVEISDMTVCGEMAQNEVGNVKKDQDDQRRHDEEKMFCSGKPVYATGTLFCNSKCIYD